MKPVDRTNDRKVEEYLLSRNRFSKLYFFEPYPKQRRFIEMSATLREMLLIAANQVGKTETGAYMVAVHMTGEYPDWWEGRRFTKAVRVWAACETSTLTRDVCQKKLCGDPGVDELFGTGLIPKSKFVDRPSLARGVTDAYDTIQVRHKSGSVSTLTFKSYEQGRKKFQSDTCDIIWLDEEAPMEIYSEALVRITATQGLLFTTYTPLQGNTTLTNRFLKEKNPDRGHITMTIYDAKHISDEERVKIIAGYPEHEREARAMGVPMQGEGRVYPFADEAVKCAPIREVPGFWRRAVAIDFGISQDMKTHPFAALIGLHDADNDILYIHHSIKIFGQAPLHHVNAIKSVAAQLPVLWPHDGHKTGPGDGKETIALAKIYKKLGLRMNHEHTTFEDEGGYSVEAGIVAIENRIKNGTLKFESHLEDLFEEFRGYYRKEGKVVAENDDLLSCLRQLIMGLRFFRAVPLGGETRNRIEQTIAEDVDFELF